MTAAVASSTVSVAATTAEPLPFEHPSQPHLSVQNAATMDPSVLTALTPEVVSLYVFVFDDFVIVFARLFLLPPLLESAIACLLVSFLYLCSPSNIIGQY
jgi:hypothetical protein